MALPTVGSTAPPVRSAASTATRNASNSRSLTSTVAPACACTTCSSESARKRLQARSISSSSAARMRRGLVGDSLRPGRRPSPSCRWRGRTARSVRPPAAAGHRRDVPPDVTRGRRDELLLGAVEDAPAVAGVDPVGGRARPCCPVLPECRIDPSCRGAQPRSTRPTSPVRSRRSPRVLVRHHDADAHGAPARPPGPRPGSGCAGGRGLALCVARRALGCSGLASG